MRRSRDRAKRLVHHSGALAAWHRRRNRGHVTVVTFHRVLAPDDPRSATADPRYTLTPALFEDCLRFFTAHYTPVSVEEILDARRGGRRLPPRPLLVTIDDGWADTEEHALGVLRRTGVPAALFAVSGTVGSPFAFWPERVIGAWRTGRLALGEATVRELVRRLTAADAATRAAALADLELDERPPDPPEMASAEQLRRLRRDGVHIGAHGVTHAPIAASGDPAREIHEPRETLAALLGEPIRTLSFPHGSYDDAALREARASGYELMFTSDAVLTPLRHGAPPSDVIGRIGVPGPAIAGPRGRLRPELLALWLFRRPVRSLEGAARAAVA